MEGHSDIITCVVAVDNLVRESFSDLITDLITVNNSINHFLSPSSSLCNSDMLTFSSTTESHSRLNGVLLSYLNLVCSHSHGLSLSLSLSLTFISSLSDVLAISLSLFLSLSVETQQ